MDSYNELIYHKLYNNTNKLFKIDVWFALTYNYNKKEKKKKKKYYLKMKGKINFNHYVKMEKAEMLLELLMKSFDIEVINFIKAKMKDRAKRKAKCILIDSGFFLRILLEFYRTERKHRLRFIQNLFVKASIIAGDVPSSRPTVNKYTNPYENF